VLKSKKKNGLVSDFYAAVQFNRQRSTESEPNNAFRTNVIMLIWWSVLKSPVRCGT